MPMLWFAAQSNISTSAERLGRRIWHARLRPRESRPKMKNLLLCIRNGSAVKRRLRLRLSRVRETEGTAPSHETALSRSTRRKRSGRTAYLRKRRFDSLICVLWQEIASRLVAVSTSDGDNSV